MNYVDAFTTGNTQPEKVLWQQRRPPCHPLGGGASPHQSDPDSAPPLTESLWEPSGVSRAAPSAREGEWTRTGSAAPGERPCVSILFIRKHLFSVTQGRFWLLAPLSVRPGLEQNRGCFHLGIIQLNTSASLSPHRPFSQALGQNLL